VVAVLLAVAALTAVGFFADRLNNGLTRDARQMLGGDAMVASDQPAPPAFAAKAAALGLSRLRWCQFPEHGARAGDDKGGDAPGVGQGGGRGYPLRGKLQLASTPGGAGAEVAAAPEPGTVWVDAGAARRAAACRSATRCCSATRACASPRSSSSSPTAAPASSASRRA
jgi:putative ABC transport system permease protein